MHPAHFLIPFALALLRPAPPADARPVPSDDPLQQSIIDDPPTTVVLEGEDLLYEVRWSVFKLGTIRFKTLKDIHDGDGVLHSAVAFMDSYKGLPFVDLHAMTYTEMDSLYATRGAQSLEKKKDRWWVLHYIVDAPAGKVYVEESWQADLQSPPETRKMTDTLHVDMKHIEDSFSLAFFARAHIRSRGAVKLPLILYGKIGTAYFEFTDEPETEEIDAIDYPVRVVPLQGHLDAEGLFGLTGEFKGWFSDDDARVPIKAKLNVILGSITVELKEWTRKGWIPPH